MHLRRVTTENSVWVFNLDLKHYIRMPRTMPLAENNEVVYTGDWEPYVELIPDGEKLMVIRPVPLGTGQWRRTGIILSDEEEVVADEVTQSSRAE